MRAMIFTREILGSSLFTRYIKSTLTLKSKILLNRIRG
jgi:hypothetical protein